MTLSMNYSLLDNDLLFSFCKQALSFFGDEASIAPTLLPFYNQCKTNLNELGKTFERETKDPYTVLKAQADSVRGNAFFAFKHYITACSLSVKENFSSAGTILLPVINKHTQGIGQMGYQKQSSVTNSLISELKREHTTDMEQCSATDWFNDLETAEVNFENIMRKSVTEITDNLPTITETRPVLEGNMRALFSFVDLMSQAAPSDELTLLVEHIGQLISETMATAKANNTRKKNQKNTEVENS